MKNQNPKLSAGLDQKILPFRGRICEVDERLAAF